MHFFIIKRKGFLLIFLIFNDVKPQKREAGPEFVLLILSIAVFLLTEREEEEERQEEGKRDRERYVY